MQHDAQPETKDPAAMTDPAAGFAVVFYDGGCGMCQRWVRFAVRRDGAGRFRFAPLQGETLVRRLDTAAREALPDSVVLLEADGKLRVKSDAALAILAGLGGGWRVLAAVGRLVPRCLRDAAYDAAARVRHRLFAPPAAACPRLPEDLRTRLLP